jgi:hypothetical protein
MDDLTLEKITMIFYILGLIFKPIFDILRTVTKNTPGPADDAALDAVERSKAYKVIAWILDWAIRVKLKK